MSIRNDDIRKCPICTSRGRDNEPCDHLCLVLRYTEILDDPEYYDDCYIYNNYPEVNAKYIDYESFKSDKRKQYEIWRKWFVDYVRRWTKDNITDENTPEKYFNEPTHEDLVRKIPREFHKDRPFCGTKIIPYNWGGSPLSAKMVNDYLFVLLNHLGPYAIELIRVIKIVSDVLCETGEFVRVSRAYLVDESGEYSGDITVKSYLGLFDFDIVYEIEYWLGGENLSTAELDEYLKLFFSLAQKGKIFNVLALESILDEISGYVWLAKSSRLSGVESDEEYPYLLVPTHLFDQIYDALGRRPPSAPNHKLPNVRSTDYERKADYEREILSFRAFMDLYHIDKQIHIRLMKIMQFINSYKIGHEDVNRDIVNIENQFPPLRKCVEELENPILRLNGEANESHRTRKDDAILKRLCERGVLDRYTFDSLMYVYSLLSWKSHAKKSVEKAQAVNEHPEFLLMILNECFRIVFYELLPKSVELMAAEHRSHT